MREQAKLSGTARRVRVARVLPLVVPSINVFRTALLSIVLTLAAGPDSALLCGTWCQSGGGMAGACQHQTETTSAAVFANADCTVSGSTIVFVREDARRGTSAPPVQSGDLLPQSVLMPPASGYGAASRGLLELRPLILALRI
jgi:hypothetical protein